MISDIPKELELEQWWKSLTKSLITYIRPTVCLKQSRHQGNKHKSALIKEQKFSVNVQQREEENKLV